jgi:flagellar basal body P-ring formation protein FlgA
MRQASSPAPAAPLGSSWLVGALCLLAWSHSGFAQGEAGAEAVSRPFHLQPTAQVDSEGVFLHQLVSVPPSTPLPPMLLTDAPVLGQTLVVSRAQIFATLRERGPELATTNWSGADRVRITRRTRRMAETDLIGLLTTTLQRDHIKERGQLELGLTRPWTPLLVPDEALTLRVTDLPLNGVVPIFTARIELRTTRESVGTWQVSLQATVWREVWVARSALKRGTILSEADLARERRDVLPVREPLAELTGDENSLELAEGLQAGTVLTARALKLRPVVRRGQNADASLQDGPLAITMKVEVLEDGVPGQTIRLRNSQSRRELRGKVINEHVILVTL